MFILFIDEQQTKFHERYITWPPTKQKKPSRALTAHGGMGFPQGTYSCVIREILFGNEQGLIGAMKSFDPLPYSSVEKPHFVVCADLAATDFFQLALDQAFF